MKLANLLISITSNQEEAGDWLLLLLRLAKYYENVEEQKVIAKKIRSLNLALDIDEVFCNLI